MRALCPAALLDKRPKRKKPHYLSAEAADVVVHVAAHPANNAFRACARAEIAAAAATAAAPPPPPTTVAPPTTVRDSAGEVGEPLWLL